MPCVLLCPVFYPWTWSSCTFISRIMSQQERHLKEILRSYMNPTPPLCSALSGVVHSPYSGESNREALPWDVVGQRAQMGTKRCPGAVAFREKAAMANWGQAGGGINTLATLAAPWGLSTSPGSQEAGSLERESTGWALRERGSREKASQHNSIFHQESLEKFHSCTSK